MMTRSGDCVNSASDDIQAGRLCDVVEILEWNIVEGPVIHGSSRMVKGRGVTESAIDSGMMGSKDSRNEASELSCFTFNAILDKAGVLMIAELKPVFSPETKSMVGS
jgi:hypothetical protein